MARTAVRGRPAGIGTELRPEIQGLRAIAVLIVVVYHIWPTALPGGFVGVDVFFVISGFLITAHLLRDVARHGRVRLASFWARRIRRLLPAALLVLAASLWLLLAALPASLWQNTLRQIGAAAVYVVNWVLASDAVDYLAAENEPTLVQHFWSLSVEEQFYIVWPLLITLVVGAFALVRWLRGRIAAPLSRSATAEAATLRRALAVVLALIFVASLTLSVWQTAVDPGVAYFSTAVRAWEFAAGGLVAFLPAAASNTRAATVLRTVSAWTGLAAILLAAALFSGATEFPGAAALLPVVGTALVLIAGTQHQAWTVTAWLRPWPVQRIGDWSYSIYLWHWPLIIAYPYVIGDQPELLGGLALLASSLALAAVTKWLVEDPVRHTQWWNQRRLPAYALAAVGALVLGFLPWQQSVQLHDQALRQQAALQADAERWASAQGRIDEAVFAAQERIAAAAHSEAIRYGCTGANAMITPADYCASKKSSDTLRPRVASLAQDVGQGFICYTQQPGTPWRGCDYGPADARTRVALIGDSHAAMLFSALRPQLDRLDWRLTVYLGRCIWTEYGKNDPCGVSTADARRDLRSGRYDLIITTGQWNKSVATGSAGRDRLQGVWSKAIAAGSQVVALADNPRLTDRMFRCLTQSGDSVKKASACRGDREDLLPEVDPYLDAAATLDGVIGIDLSDLYCADTTCAAAIGGVAVYRDTHHVTTSYWRTLLPHFLERLQAARAALADSAAEAGEHDPDATAARLRVPSS